MKQLLVLLLLLCSAVANAQDVIVKKDGSTILSKVLEVGQEEIKYKKYDNIDGPTYTIQKSELQGINYQNGARDTFSAPVREENRYLPNNQNDGVQQYNDMALLKMDKNRINPYKNVNKKRILAWAGGGAMLAAGVAFYFVYKGSKEEKTHDDYWYNKEWALPVSIACTGVAVGWTTYFLISANKEKRLIDNTLISAPIFQYDFNFSDGSSLSAGIDMLNYRTIGNNTIGLGLRYNF